MWVLPWILPLHYPLTGHTHLGILLDYLQPRMNEQDYSSHGDCDGAQRTSGGLPAETLGSHIPHTQRAHGKKAESGNLGWVSGPYGAGRSQKV